MAEQNVCPWWLAYTFDNPLRHLVHNPEKMLGPYVHQGQWAADIGCGMGFFSLGLARLVGPGGRVFSLDLQEKMLARVRRRARRAGLEDCIETRRVGAHGLEQDDLRGRLALVLTFWMLHEVPDQAAFLEQARDLLQTDGVLFLAEPRMHVTEGEFAVSLDIARAAGFTVEDAPVARMSRAAVLRRA